MAATAIIERLDKLFESCQVQKDWQAAVQNRLQAATFASQAGRTDLSQRCFQEAITTAENHGLKYLELGARMAKFQYLMMQDLSGRTLDDLRENLDCKEGELGIELTGVLSEKLEQYATSVLAANDQVLAGETERKCAGLRVDLFLLAADFNIRRKCEDIAQMLLRGAEQLCGSLPEKRCNVQTAWAGLCDQQGKLNDAISHAREAVRAAEQTNFVALKSQAANLLDGMLERGTKERPQPDPPAGSGATDRVMRALGSAHHALQNGDLEYALRLANQALEQAVTPPLRRAVLRERGLVLLELKRYRESEADFDACISLLSAELASDAEVAKGALDNRIKDEENCHLLKAWLRANAGQSTEAWDIAEQGRSQRLKREIKAAGGFPSESLTDTSFGATREWLQSKRAAILSFAATPWGTLVLTAGPEEAAPEAQILKEFSTRELKRVIGQNGGPDSANSDQAILSSDVIKELSAGLIHPLSKRLRTISESARVLVIIPDSYLYSAPFAALTLESTPGSQMLIDLCPLSYAPSTAILRWCADRRASPSSRECLAVAVGRDTTNFDFQNHLTQIAKVPWPTPPMELRDEAATIEAVTAQAPLFPVLYFSCHGAVSEQSRDLLTASQIKLAANAILTAREVSTWKLCAKLVFLNACQSGRFRMESRSDVNGFVRAFLLAGASAIIAPLIQVDPRAAGDLAEAFFRSWVAGASASEALRDAQLAARENDPERKEWATYCLSGDFR